MPLARAAATAAATPSVQGAPWPGRIHSASMPSMRSRDASAWSGSALKAATCGPRAPFVTSSVDSVSPARSAPTDGASSAVLPGVWPGVWMTRSAPGTSRVASEANVVTFRGFRDPQRSPPRAPEQEVEQRAETTSAESRARVGDLAASQRGVELVHADRHPTLVTDALGEADVVGMAVRQDQRAHVIDRASHGPQLTDEVAVEAGEAGIDDRDLAGFFDEIAVDVVVAEPVQGRSESHDALLSAPATPS